MEQQSAQNNAVSQRLEIRQGVSLQPFNTLAVPATASYFCQITSPEQLQEALSWLRTRRKADRDFPLLLLGGGSNIVLQRDFPGLVLRLQLLGKGYQEKPDGSTILTAACGENWHELVKESLDRGCHGLENLALIPGCVGAAPIQNIGAYGVELADVFESLTAIDIHSGATRNFALSDCLFGYRDSVFKNHLKNQFVIASVSLKLHHTMTCQITYPELQRQLQAEDKQVPTPHDVFTAVCQIRRRKLPDPEDIPNVGSFFKNPVISSADFAVLMDLHPNAVGYRLADERVKVAAGWLIDQAGWRGVLAGKVGVHQHQALVLTNPGKAMGREVVALAQRIQEDVDRRFGLKLEIEPNLI